MNVFRHPRVRPRLRLGLMLLGMGLAVDSAPAQTPEPGDPAAVSGSSSAVPLLTRPPAAGVALRPGVPSGSEVITRMNEGAAAKETVSATDDAGGPAAAIRRALPGLPDPLAVMPVPPGLGDGLEPAAGAAAGLPLTAATPAGLAGEGLRFGPSPEDPAAMAGLAGPPDLFTSPGFTGAPAGGANFAGFGLDRRPLGSVAPPGSFLRKRVVQLGGSRVRFGASVNAGSGWNTNVQGATSGGSGDLISWLQPVFYLETGSKGSVRFLWAPSFVQFAKYREYNSFNQTFLFSSRYRWTKLKVGLDASYLAQSGLFLNSQGQAQQRALYARLFADYPLTRKTDLTVIFEGTHTSTDQGGGQVQGAVTADIAWRLYEKLRAGGGVSLGYFTSDAGNLAYETLLLRLIYDPTTKITVRAEGGAQFRQSAENAFRTSGTPTYLVNFFVGYRPSSKTSLGLRLFRNVTEDAFNPGTLQIQTGVESSLVWRIHQKVSFDASVAAGYVDNTSLNTTANIGNYTYAQAGLGVSYLLLDQVRLRLFNNYQQRSADTEGFDYSSNMSGMNLGVNF